MIRDTIRAMLKALPDVKEDGHTLIFDPGWEVTMHAGRNGSLVSVQLLTKITLDAEFALVETQKSQRIVLLHDEIRGFAAEPSSTDRKGRKTGFV